MRYTAANHQGAPQSFACALLLHHCPFKRPLEFRVADEERDIDPEPMCRRKHTSGSSSIPPEKVSFRIGPEPVISRLSGRTILKLRCFGFR